MPAHPFADHLGLTVVQSEPGRSRCVLTIEPFHLNPNRVAHGAVLFALADTGMGAALVPALKPGQACATIDLHINFLAPVPEGEVSCETTLIRLGRNVAHLESRLQCGPTLVATAAGHYTVFERRPPPA